MVLGKVTSGQLMYGQFHSREIPSSYITTEPIETNSPAQRNLNGNEKRGKINVWIFHCIVDVSQIHTHTLDIELVLVLNLFSGAHAHQVKFINQINAMLIQFINSNHVSEMERLRHREMFINPMKISIVNNASVCGNYIREYVNCCRTPCVSDI